MKPPFFPCLWLRFTNLFRKRKKAYLVTVPDVIVHSDKRIEITGGWVVCVSNGTSAFDLDDNGQYYFGGYSMPELQRLREERKIKHDYRELLEKYIAHVGNCEGVSFLESFKGDAPPWISAEEWAELRKLDLSSERFGYPVPDGVTRRPRCTCGNPENRFPDCHPPECKNCGNLIKP